jgi:uncharacterized protein YjiS (DUF1127 family)
MAIAEPRIARRGASSPFVSIGGVLGRVAAWDARFRARRALAALSSDRLRDLGLTAQDVARETAKPLWRA